MADFGSKILSKFDPSRMSPQQIEAMRQIALEHDPYGISGGSELYDPFLDRGGAKTRYNTASGMPPIGSPETPEIRGPLGMPKDVLAKLKAMRSKGLMSLFSPVGMVEGQLMDRVQPGMMDQLGAILGDNQARQRLIQNQGGII